MNNTIKTPVARPGIEVKQVQQLIKINGGLESENESLKNQIKELRSMVASSTLDHHGLEKEIADLKVENQHLKNVNSTLTKDNESLSEKLSEELELNKTLNEKYNKLEEERNVLFIDHSKLIDSIYKVVEQIEGE